MPGLPFVCNSDYYESFRPNPYVRSPIWLRHFASIADNIIRTLRPQRVLDVGCAMGFLVEALRDRGVDAWGIDNSPFAIQSGRIDIQPYCQQISVLDYSSAGPFDVVTCMGVLEQITPDLQPHAIARIASLTDTILFSSSPSRYADRTHASVRSIEGWLNLFSIHGYCFDPLFDASFIASHALLLRRQAVRIDATGSFVRPRHTFPQPPPLHSPSKRALFVSGCPGDPYRYRCEHQGEQLGLLGWDVHYASPAIMVNPVFTTEYDLVVLHRLAHWDGMDPIIERLRAKSVPVIFDTDDLVFSEEAVNDIQEFRNCPPQGRNAYIDSIRNMAATLRLCTGALVSTEPLQLAVHRIAPHVPVWVNRNALSNIMVAQADTLQHTYKRAKSELVRLGYFSGTFTHEADFSVCCEAVAHILRDCPQARLILAGRVQVPTLLAPLLDRVQIFPYVPWRELPGLLLQADINLAPLEKQNEFTGCKSELKYLEAGVLGIPTIASPVGGYVSGIVNGQTGFLCDSRSEWEVTLSALIEQPLLREIVGGRARQDVLEKHVTTVRSTSLGSIIDDIFRDVQRLSAKGGES